MMNYFCRLFSGFLILMVAGTATYGADNKGDVRSSVEARHDKVIWGKEIDHEDYLKFLASLPGGPPAVAAYLEDLVSSILKETGEAVAKETVFDVLRGKSEHTLLGGRPVYVQIATYNHFTIESYPEFNKGRLKEGKLRVPRPNTHQLYIAIGRKKGLQQTADISPIPARFRAVNDWASRHGYPTAFPNFHEAPAPDDKELMYGTFAFLPSVAVWHDIPKNEVVGLNDSPDSRFRAVHACG